MIGLVASAGIRRRGRRFSDWHAQDKAALQDYLDLDGVGEPD